MSGTRKAPRAPRRSKASGGAPTPRTRTRGSRKTNPRKKRPMTAPLPVDAVVVPHPTAFDGAEPMTTYRVIAVHSDGTVDLIEDGRGPHKRVNPSLLTRLN